MTERIPPGGAWRAPATIGALLATVVGGMIYVLIAGQHISSVHDALINAVENVDAHVSHAYLVVEKRRLNPAAPLIGVEGHLKEAQDALRFIRRNGTHRHLLNQHPDLRRQGTRLAQLTAGMARFRSDVKRLVGGDGGETPDLDTDYAKIRADVNRLHTLFEDARDTHLVTFRRTQIALIALITAFGLLLTVMSYRLDRRRRRHLSEVLDATRQQQKSERLLAAIYAASPDMIFLHAEDGRVVDVNDNALSGYGLTRSEALTAEVGALSGHGCTREMARAKLALARAGEPQDFEWVARRKNGEQFPVEVRLRRLPELDGADARIIAVVRDLSARKHAEAALAESQIRHREAQRIARLGHWELNLANNELIWSDELYRIFEIVGERATHEPYMQRIHPDDRAYVEQTFSASIAERTPGDIVFRLRMADGRIKHVNDRWEIHADAAGASLRAIGTVQDLTVRIEAQQVSARLAAAVEQTADVIFITNRDAVIEYVNPAFERTYGYRRADVVGQSTRILKSNEQDEAFYRKMWDTLLAGNTWHGELTDRHQDGARVEVQCTITPIRGGSGAIQSFVAIQRDVSRERTLRRQMEHGQRLESMGVLAGGIAHDFNNILTAVMGNAAMAERASDPGAPTREYIARIVSASQRAADICQDMLAYSGKGKFVVQPINLSTVVEDLTRLLEVSISKKAVLKYDLAPNLPATEADAAQIQQVIMNLITNASEALGERSGAISIATSVVRADRAYLATTFSDEDLAEGRYVYLEVADTGCGMDAATRDKIFDPFFTTKFTGRGLGMSAVLGIVRGYHGAIKVYSEVGKGTTFKVFLPCAAGEPRAIAETATGAEGEWRGSGTVLVVDDEEVIREIASLMLAEMGFATLTANDGLEGVETLRAHGDEIVLVLLDMTMPRMNGEETFTEMRRVRPDIRVVLSSGYNQQSATQRFSGKGLAGFIQKPYMPDKLQSVLRSVLEHE